MMRKLILIAVMELPSVTLLEFDDIEKVDGFLMGCFFGSQFRLELRLTIMWKKGTHKWQRRNSMHSGFDDLCDE